MIFNYDGKSYDTADGQEQPHAESARKPAETERLDIDRWSDDGASGRSPASVLKDMIRRATGVGRLRRNATAAAVQSEVTSAPSRTPSKPTSSPGDGPSPGSAAAERLRAFYTNSWENT